MAKTLLQLPATKDHGSLLITAKVENKVAYLSIDGYIHPWADASSKNLKREIVKLKKEGATTADVYINSEGGVCFQANEMANILKENFGKHNIKVRVGALAASAASFLVAVFNKNATAYSNTKFMVHKPKGGFHGTAAQILKSIKSLQDLEDDYRKEYARAFNISEDEVEALWKEGDHWMTAEEALTEGLIASIVKEDAKITPAAHMQLVAAGAPNIPEPTPGPKPNNQNSNTDMNTKVLAVKLGLPETATEAEINAALEAQKSKADIADTLQTKLDQQAKNAKEANIKAMLDQAEQDKKITGDTREHYEAFAEANFEGCKKALEAMQPVAKIETKTTAQNPAHPTAEGDYKTYQDYLDAGAEGATAFQALMESDAVKAQALLDSHYPEKNPV